MLDEIARLLHGAKRILDRLDADEDQNSRYSIRRAARQVEDALVKCETLRIRQDAVLSRYALDR